MSHSSLAAKLNMSSKATYQPNQPGVYRDHPDHAETASMSSAVLLDDVESAFPDEDLPAYEDTQTLIPGVAEPPVNTQTPEERAHRIASVVPYYEPPPVPPFSSHDLFLTEYRTHFPNYSNNAKQLYDLIHSQANYSPSYFVQVHGTHEETRRNGNKETKDKVTDFWIRINITHLITQQEGGAIELIPGNKRGYRGTIIPKLKPTVTTSPLTDEETPSLERDVQDGLRRWCEEFVENPHKVKSFTLKRKIINHDTKRLTQLLQSAISETGYRGHTYVDFPIMYQKLIIYSPSPLNKWRMTVWIRWVFYLTFLWIFAWPILFFLTSRYEVVTAVYSYADSEPGNDSTRKCAVMSETQWFDLWQSSIKRAALARMINKDVCLDEEYRVSTERADARGLVVGPNPVPRTGNAYADAAVGLFSQGLSVVANYNSSRGWGGDC